MIETSRRRFLVLAASAAGLAIVPMPGGIARATPADVAAKIKEVVGEAELKKGRVKLDLPVMVENGNAVGMTVSVEAPLSGADRVESVHVFAEGNPLPNVAHFYFGPRAGKPLISTRIRLADSQTVIAVAKLADGTCWSDSVELMVTLAACLEGTL
jgi:sulfur-oxidizing protein SoxY